MIAIVEDYRDYQPPPSVKRSIERLVSGLPERCHSEIEAIVLTNATAVGPGKTMRRRGRKYLRRECLGFYHYQDRRGKAWIEIVVDNALHGFPSWALKIPSVEQMTLGDVLFHEVGHHLNATVGPLARVEELAADAWRKRLLWAHIRSNYWYLLPIMWLAATAGAVLLKRRRAFTADRAPSGSPPP